MHPTLVALIDRCYEFVLTDSPPDDLLTDTAHSLGFEVGSVISTARRAGTSRSACLAATGLDVETCQKAEDRHQMTATGTLSNGIPMAAGQFLAFSALDVGRAMTEQPYFEEFLAPNNLLEGAKIILLESPTRSIFMNLARPTPGLDREQQARMLEVLAPHLVRSTLIGVKLGQADGFRQLSWKSVNLCPYPMVVLDNTRGVFLANRLAQNTLLGDGLKLTSHGLGASLRLQDHQLQKMLFEAIAVSNSGKGSAHGQELSITRASGKRPYQLMVMPLMPGLQRPGYRPAAIVLVVDPDAGHAACVPRCQAVFGFTRAEAAVAIGIMEGLSLEQISEQHHRALSTTRNLLKRVFQKANVSRQNELTQLMLYSAIVMPTFAEPTEGQGNADDELHWD